MESEIPIENVPGLIKTERDTDEISKIEELDSMFEVTDTKFIKVEQESKDFERECIPFNLCSRSEEHKIEYPVGNFSGTKCEDFETEYKSDNVKMSPKDVDISREFSNSNEKNDESSTTEKLHKCDTCGKTVRTYSGLAKHRRLHKPTSCKILHKCDSCGTTYTTSTGLSRHLKLHTGERPYPCQQCDKTFVDRGKLRVHVLRYHGEHPYNCDTCGKGLISYSVLQIHMRSHTGEKPYQCNNCEKSFVSKGSLRMHINTLHNNNYPYHNLWHERYLH